MEKNNNNNKRDSSAQRLMFAYNAKFNHITRNDINQEDWLAFQRSLMLGTYC